MSTTTLQKTEHVIFSNRAWNQLRPLLLDPGLFAVGPVRCISNLRDRWLLVDDLEVTGHQPVGTTRPPFDAWCVVVVEHLAAPDPLMMLRRIAPKESHLVVAIGLHAQLLDVCRMVVWDQGDVRPLESLRVGGPGLLRVDRQAGDLDNSLPADDQRWSRTIGALGPETFARIRQTEVTIVGLGRLGSQMAFHLAALGVAALRLIDGDRLELWNLDAMPGLELSDVGKFKVEALAARLCRFRSDLTVSYVAQAVTEPAAEELLSRRSDLFVSTADNDTARLAVSLASRRLLVPHLDVATSIQRNEATNPELTADIRLLLPLEGCVGCVGGLDDAKLRRYELAAPPGVLQRGRARPWQAERAGSLLSLNSLAIGTAASMFVDFCATRLDSSFWQRMRWVPGQGPQFDGGPVTAAEDCAFCRRRQT